MRTFCKTPGKKNIPIQAIGLSLYEEMGTEDSTQEKLGKEIVRTQWLDFSTLGKMSLLGRRVLIVVGLARPNAGRWIPKADGLLLCVECFLYQQDEVDDTRTTLSYAINELQQDLEKQVNTKPV
jgi:hypoxanthine phosphoribosyltransferase